MKILVLTLALGLMAAVLPGGAAAQSAEYYVVENGQQAGPYSLEALAVRAQQGLVTQQSLVWTNGMADWQPAGAVPALAIVWQNQSGGDGPPPLPPGGTNTGGTTVPQTNPGAGTTALDQLAQKELEDMGVPAGNQLHTGAMHGPTPNSIPGGQVITTKGISELLQRRQQFRIFDVLGGETVIPGAIDAVAAHQPGSFSDPIQQRMEQFLQQVTQNNKQLPLIFYCASTKCWMSYNASLRAINLGYTNVLWYRGGVEAWQAAGLQVMPRGQTGQTRQGQQQFQAFN